MSTVFLFEMFFSLCVDHSYQLFINFPTVAPFPHLFFSSVPFEDGLETSKLQRETSFQIFARIFLVCI